LCMREVDRKKRVDYNQTLYDITKLRVATYLWVICPKMLYPPRKCPFQERFCDFWTS